MSDTAVVKVDTEKSLYRNNVDTSKIHILDRAIMASDTLVSLSGDDVKLVYRLLKVTEDQVSVARELTSLFNQGVGMEMELFERLNTEFDFQVSDLMYLNKYTRVQSLNNILMDEEGIKLVSHAEWTRIYQKTFNDWKKEAEATLSIMGRVWTTAEKEAYFLMLENMFSIPDYFVDDYIEQLKYFSKKISSEQRQKLWTNVLTLLKEVKMLKNSLKCLGVILMNY